MNKDTNINQQCECAGCCQETQPEGEERDFDELVEELIETASSGAGTALEMTSRMADILMLVCREFGMKKSSKAAHEVWFQAAC